MSDKAYTVVDLKCGAFVSSRPNKVDALAVQQSYADNTINDCPTVILESGPTPEDVYAEIRRWRAENSYPSNY